jgi:adenylate cyclase
MLYFSSDIAALPERLRLAIREQQADAEILIAWVQLAIVLLFSLVYAAAPKAFPEMSRFEPVPLVLGAYIAITLSQLGLAYLRRLAGILLGAFVVADVVLLLVLIWSFHIQYLQPPSFSLKAPTLLLVFIFIALRALRVDAGYVLLAGFVAAAGWTALVAYALAESLPGAVTHDFIDYITSDRILIGAEIEKIIAILSVTVILALAISRARGLLIRLVTERSAAHELSRFFDPGIAARIRDAEHHIRAGRGEVCEGAILIFDIRGFTAFSNHLSPNEVMALLAEYQARLIPIIQNHGGSIDKFLGDGVIATFGVARPSPAYAADAIVALDEALAEIDRWNADRHTAGLHPVVVNAALTIGPVIFGAVGDDTRLEYTVIGEPVNLAAKLDKHNKKSRTRALATQDAFAMALAQGYRPRAPRQTRSACRIDGTDAPVDLVVLA